MKKNELTIKSAVASIAGAGVGVYVGSNLVVPGAAAAGIWYLGRFVKPKEPLFLAAIALLAGHWVWLLIGTAIVGAWHDNWVDISVMFALVLWLWLRPSLSAVITLTVVETLALFVNGAVIASQAPGSVPHKALFLHIVLRCVTLFLAWNAYRAWRRGGNV